MTAHKTFHKNNEFIAPPLPERSHYPWKLIGGPLCPRLRPNSYFTSLGTSDCLATTKLDPCRFHGFFFGFGVRS